MFRGSRNHSLLDPKVWQFNTTSQDCHWGWAGDFPGHLVIADIQGAPSNALINDLVHPSWPPGHKPFSASVLFKLI